MYEEAYAARGRTRAQYADVLRMLEGCDLAALKRRVDELLAARGVTFGSKTSDAFLVDPVPRVLTAAEWGELEAGLVQRVRALSAFVADVYGPRRIVAEGVVPGRVVESADHYEPDLAGFPAAGAHPVAVAGLDVVRDERGRFLVLEDNVRTPSGIAYAIAAREAICALVPRHPPLRELDPAFDALAAALRDAAPAHVDDPYIVEVSDGPANPAWYEHRVIADRLGLALVRVEQLELVSGELYARADGGQRRVDVLYRRTNDERLVDERGRPTALGAKVLEPLRHGRLGVVNAFGAGVADDKLAHAYVEAMIRFYLDEEPLIESVPTYDLADPAVRDAALASIDEIVVKPRSASGGRGVLIGPHARPEDRERVARAVEEHPEAFVAQRTVPLSRHPTVVDGRLEPRHVDLRAFVFLASDGGSALPGGLTRVALERDALVVNSSQDGGAKDTWVLAG